MRILLDENLPMRLIAALRALGHDVEHVYTKNLSSRPDPDVRAVAESEQRFLITQDRRFAETWTGCFVVSSDSKLRVVRPV